jgi:hypothetical protein
MIGERFLRQPPGARPDSRAMTFFSLHAFLFLSEKKEKYPLLSSGSPLTYFNYIF